MVMASSCSQTHPPPPLSNLSRLPLLFSWSLRLPNLSFFLCMGGAFCELLAFGPGVGLESLATVNVATASLTAHAVCTESPSASYCSILHLCFT